MPYANEADLADRLTEELLILLTDENHDGQSDAAVLTAALVDASSIIDHSMGGRYETPLTDPPGVVRRWCADLAIGLLFLRRRESITREHGERFAETRAQLERIAMGEEPLPGAQPKAGRFASENTRRGEPRAFGPDGPSGY